MVLQVEPLARSEITEAAALHQRAFADDPLINSAFPSAAQSPKWLQHMADALEMAYENSTEHLLKVQHPETGKLMGIVQWQDCTQQSEDESSSEPSAMPPPLEGTNMELVKARRRLRAETRQSIIGDRPHYCEFHQPGGYFETLVHCLTSTRPLYGCDRHSPSSTRCGKAVSPMGLGSCGGSRCRGLP